MVSVGAGAACRTCNEHGWVPDTSQRECIQEEEPCNLAASAPVSLYLSIGAVGGAVAGIGLTLAVMGCSRCRKSAALVGHADMGAASCDTQSPMSVGSGRPNYSL